MTRRPDKRPTMVIDTPAGPAVIPKSNRVCPAFKQCIQPHICEPSDTCIWGVRDEGEIDAADNHT